MFPKRPRSALTCALFARGHDFSQLHHAPIRKSMILFRNNAALLSLAISLCAFAPGCGSDDSDISEHPECEVGQQWNELLGVCKTEVRNGSDAGPSQKDSNSGDTNKLADTHADDTDAVSSTPDTTPPDSSSADADEDTQIDCRDLDRDGYFDSACGGQDCNDQDATVHPGANEMCNELDNDCDGEINQGINCSFYAHSPTELYLVDPFKQTATFVTDVPNLTDMDTHPDGTLYGITFDDLYRYNESTTAWTVVGPLNASGNGLAINNNGVAFLTAGGTVYTVDLGTGNATQLGAIGGGLISSGDCVVNKDNSLFMTSPSTNFGNTNDTLVSIDPSGHGTQVGSDLGFGDIYALTAAWGHMFGLSGDGQLIEINSSTGSATLIHEFSGIQWYGAASTPQR